ncbi:MAG: hypothetical protein ACKVU4_01545 [Phycisphaerales bacterium]
MTRHGAGTAGAALLVLVSAAAAQVGGGFDFSWSRITGGGGTSGSGGFELKAAIGQWEAGEMVAGPFGLLTGAWGASAAPVVGPGSCDPGWKFGLDQGWPGVNGQVYATTVWDPDGAGPTPEWLVLAGGFTVAGDIFVKNIAAWDGAAWHDLAGGTDSSVYALTVYNGDLIAGGIFSQAGGALASHIARYDGAAWHSLDTGISPIGSVSELTVYQGELIASGSFTSAGGVAASNIARWDGIAWQALGLGISGQEVRALAVLGSDLYAGGEFQVAGGAPANYIARWDGFAWSPLGAGTGAGVYALAPRSNGTLVVGGAFIQAGGVSAGRIALWAPQGGGAWQNPFAGGIGGTVLTLREVNGHLLIGGQFANSVSLQNIVGWSPGGSGNFETVGYGADGAVSAIETFGGRLVIGGAFAHVGPPNVLGQPTTAHGVAIFDVALCPIPGCPILGGWRRVTPGVYGTVESLGVSGGQLFMGGYPFDSAGHVNPAAMARWNGDTWNVLVGSTPGPPGGTPGTAYGPSYYPWGAVVQTIIDYQGTLVIGGQFNNPEFLTQNISSWTGNVSYWGNLFFDPINGSQDLDANVYALTTWDPDGPGPFGLMLIAGGDFTTAGRNGLAVPASRVAGFRYPAWTAFGSGVNGRVSALAVYNGDLIVGGSFTQAGGAPAPHIARLSLTGSPGVWTWSPLGEGIGGVHVLSLLSHNGSLYAGGQFSDAGGVPAANIARWDGDTWHPVGDGLGNPGNSPVLALASYRGDLYAGGLFQGSFGPGGNVFMANVGRWDGAAWHPLDGGINGMVNALTDYQGRLIIGGGFTNVNGRVSHNWARWEPDVIAPAIAQGAFPPGQTRRCGEDAGFGVTIAFGTSPTFRWRRNGVPLVNGHTGAGSTIENATTPGLSIRDVTLADAGQYDCVVANSCGTVTSAAATLMVCAGYADCNCDAVRTVADFGCFQSKFVLGDMYADCNGSGTLSVADFGCFQVAFIIGCP